MRSVLLLALGLASSFAPGSLPAQDARSHLDFRQEAEAAYQQKDYAIALAATRQALALRSDSPRYLHNLAALSVRTGDQRAALDYLRRLAALGVATNIERDPDLAPLQDAPEFARIRSQFAANREPQGAAELLAELPGRTGIIEGIAFREKTGDLFLGDVHHRCIWRRDRAGQVTRFTAEDETLFGIFGLVIDEARGALWAATSALPEMSGFEPALKGQAALAEFDLRTGEIRRIIPVAVDGREHGLGDVALGPDGTVYASDSKAPVVWKYSYGSEELEKAVDSPVFSSLQGIVVERTTLLVADYAHGLLAVDLPTQNITALTPPENTTLLGLDGLTALPGGGLIGIQNGTTPQRVLRIQLSPELDKVVSVQVLAAALPGLTDLCLVTLAQNRPTFIAGSGWDALEAAKSKQPPAHTVRLFQIDLP